MRQYIGARYVPKFFEDSNGSSEWASGVAYEPLTIVTYNSNSYTSKKTVPATIGAPNLNPEYWVSTGIYNAQIDEYRQEVQDALLEVEGVKRDYIRKFSNVATMIASEDLTSGDVVVTLGYYDANDGGEGTYLITSNGSASYHVLETAGGLYAHLITDSTVNVDALGAKGDGITDDADIINYALENYDEIQLSAGKNYYITSTIHVPYGKSFIGNSATITAAAYSIFTNLNVAGLPTKVAIFAEGREPIVNSEQKGYTKKIAGFKLYEDGTQEDGIGSDGFVGIYAGYKTALTGTNSKVNYSVYGYSFEDILVYGFGIGFYVAEVWQGKFSKIVIRNFKKEGLSIRGQSVNNYYTEMEIDGRAHSETELYGIRLNVSNTYNNRPEGNMFVNVGVFSCNYNIWQTNGLSTQFSNCMSDLAITSALGATVGDMMVENSWLGSRNGASALTQPFTSPTVWLSNISTADAGNKVTLANCNIVNANQNSGETPFAVAQGYGRYSDIVVNCNCAGSVRQTNQNAALFIMYNSFKYDSDTIYTMGNGKRTGNYKGIDGSEMT